MTGPVTQRVFSEEKLADAGRLTVDLSLANSNFRPLPVAQTNRDNASSTGSR